MGSRPAKKHERAPTPLPLEEVQMHVAICLALAAAVVAVYAQSYGFGFLGYDDMQYGTPPVLAGLTVSGAAWAFTTFALGNWHPLTWLSYMLDCKLFSPDNAGAHHLVNAALHLASTVLLFFAFIKMTGRPWRSALVAAIFALHPLHVESVAWIAERKDVLSGFFAAATLLLYARYAAAPSAVRYAVTTGTFAAGLMSKPMLVTLPCVLLLLDFWPLGRFGWPQGRWKPRRAVLDLLAEKFPLLALSAACSALNIVAHNSIRDIYSLAARPLSDRIVNALVASVIYLGKALWPVNLAVLYPYHPFSTTAALGAVVVLAALTYAAARYVRRCPYLLVGWLWFFGMLLPVSGLLPVGHQALADRYTYLPLIGLSLSVVWGLADIVQRYPRLRDDAAAFALVVLFAFSTLAWQQAATWKNDLTLYRHALAVTKDNPIMQSNLCYSLEQAGEYEEALPHCEEALRLDPNYDTARGNLALVNLELARRNRAAHCHPVNCALSHPEFRQACERLNTACGP